MNQDQQKILTMPLAELKASEKFLNPAERMGFTNLQQIVNLPSAELIKNKHFSYTWLYELMNLLDQHQLLHLMDDET